MTVINITVIHRAKDYYAITGVGAKRHSAASNHNPDWAATNAAAKAFGRILHVGVGALLTRINVRLVKTEAHTDHGVPLRRYYEATLDPVP
jgi:hypothetical protein